SRPGRPGVRSRPHAGRRGAAAPPVPPGGPAGRPGPDRAVRGAEIPAAGRAPPTGDPAVRLRDPGYAPSGGGAGRAPDRRLGGRLRDGRGGAPDAAGAPRGRPERDGPGQAHRPRLQRGRAPALRLLPRLLLLWVLAGRPAGDRVVADRERARERERSCPAAVGEKSRARGPGVAMALILALIDGEN